MTRSRRDPLAPALGLAWLAAAVAAASATAAQLVPTRAEAGVLPTALALAAGLFVLILGAVGTVRAVRGKTSSRGLFGLPWRDYAFALVFTGVATPLAWW